MVYAEIEEVFNEYIYRGQISAYKNYFVLTSIKEIEVIYIYI